MLGMVEGDFDLMEDQQENGTMTVQIGAVVHYQRPFN